MSGEKSRVVDPTELACTNCYIGYRSLEHQADGQIKCAECGAIQPPVSETPLRESVAEMVERVVDSTGRKP